MSGTSGGRSAARPVEVESRVARDSATTPPRQMGARTALGNIQSLLVVTQSLVSYIQPTGKHTMTATFNSQ